MCVGGGGVTRSGKRGAASFVVVSGRQRANGERAGRSVGQSRRGGGRAGNSIARGGGIFGLFRLITEFDTNVRRPARPSAWGIFLVVDRLHPFYTSIHFLILIVYFVLCVRFLSRRYM